MRYEYPKISNVLTYKKTGDGKVEVTDHFIDEKYIFSIETARYIRKLDGNTDPYDIPTELTKDEICEVIEYLEENLLTRKSDILIAPGGCVYKTLWVIKKTPLLKRIAVIWNFLLLLLWLPILVAGILIFKSQVNYIMFDGIWVGYVIGLICGMIFHELGHAFAGLSYGAYVFETGVMIQNFIMPGAYVILDEEKIRNRLKRVQISAAGAESNLLLTGLFLLSGALIPEFGGMFMTAGICNAFLALVNLIFIRGLDGTSVISDLLGVKDVVEKATTVVKSKKARIKLLEKGVSGRAVIMMSGIIVALQIALPVILVLNVLEIILCFV